MEVTCEWDQCCTFPPATANARYCPLHRCKRKAEAAARRLPERSAVRCHLDGCHEFPPGSSTARYCPDCGCAAKAKRVRELEQQDQLFESPREFSELEILQVPDGYKVLILNDHQIPFHDRDVIGAVHTFARDLDPDLIILNGDIFDFYQISTFSQNPSRRFSLQDELDMARAYLWSLRRQHPNARIILVEGNHEDRLRRFLWKYAAQLSSLRALTVETLLGLAEMEIESIPYMSRVNLLGFRIEHGYKASASKAYPVNVARYMAIATGASGLVGHTHHFSTYSWTDSRSDHTYVENGALCRFDLEYAPFPNWQHGFTYGVCYNGIFYITPTRVLPAGFRAEGEFYRKGSRG